MTLVGARYDYNNEQDMVSIETEIVESGATTKTIFGEFKLAKKGKMLRDEIGSPKLDKDGLSGYVYIEYKNKESIDEVLKVLENALKDFHKKIQEHTLKIEKIIKEI